MTKLDELQKAIEEAAATSLEMLRKSDIRLHRKSPNPHAYDHHVAYTRTNANGTVSNIQAKGAPPIDHEARRQKKQLHDHRKATEAHRTAAEAYPRGSKQRMNGSEKQIKWAEQIISDFVAGCETAKSALSERIENYHRRAAKTGKDFSENIADVNAEMAIIDACISMIQTASDASRIIDIRGDLEKLTNSMTTEWDSSALSRVKFAAHGRN